MYYFCPFYFLLISLERRVRFELTIFSFADLLLRPLGHQRIFALEVGFEPTALRLTVGRSDH